MPNNSVSKSQPLIGKYWIEHYVERDDCSIVDVVTHLPANRPLVIQQAHALAYDLLLRFEVCIQRGPRLVSLAEVIGGRSDNKLEMTIRKPLHEGKVILAGKHRWRGAHDLSHQVLVAESLTIHPGDNRRHLVKRVHLPHIVTA